MVSAYHSPSGMDSLLFVCDLMAGMLALNAVALTAFVLV
jgi:hypothetical protein